MECPRGHGETIEQQVDLAFCEAVPPAKIVGVPADVCPVCDDRFFEFAVAQRVEELKERLHVPDRTIRMNVIYYTASQDVKEQETTITVVHPFTQGTNVPVGA